MGFGNIVFLGVVEFRTQSQVGHADNAVHRRTNFVRHISEKQALDAVGFFGLTLGHLQLLGAFRHLLLEVFSMVAQLLFRAQALHDNTGETRSGFKVDQLLVVRQGRMVVVHTKSTQHISRIVLDRFRPAAAHAMGQRHMLYFRPLRIGFDAFNQHAFSGESGGATRAHTGAVFQTIYRLTIGFGQARCATMHEFIAMQLQH